MSIDEIINKLKSLDLSTYPKEEIEALFNQLGMIGSIVVTYHKGKSVIRARPNYDGEHFTEKSQLSFKPPRFNTTYQRASTPNTTMFYATSIPDKIKDGELDNARVIGVAETIPLLRDKERSGYQKISFGRWVVEEDIDLVAIVHKESYLKESSYTRELKEAYDEFSVQAPKEIMEKSLKFHTYLADEFSKEEINEDYDYMISAIFSELITKRGFDGVIYPSVRAGGKGFNIAITPEATKKLKLRVAGESTVYKRKEEVFVGNDAIVELNGDEEEFQMNELNGFKTEILEKLNVQSMDELNDDD
ncbi:MAG: hypothetical protein HWE22_13995 [Flavobacteriales bacterium]|nr:hypothetical protein [Flavobacteriales bacterium]